MRLTLKIQKWQMKILNLHFSWISSSNVRCGILGTQHYYTKRIHYLYNVFFQVRDSGGKNAVQLDVHMPLPVFEGNILVH